MNNSFKDIDKVERVQRKAARFVMNNYDFHSSVTQMLNDMGCNRLAERRRDL